MKTELKINGESLAVDQYNMLTEIKEMREFPLEIIESEMYVDHIGTRKCSGWIHRFESDSDLNCVMQDDNGGLFLCNWDVQKSNNEV